MGSTVVLLTEAEVAAFLSPASDPEGTLRRAVGVRTLLVQAIENTKSEPAGADLAAAVRLGSAEAQRLDAFLRQRQGGASGPAGDSFTAARKQLNAVMSHARQAMRQARA